MKSSTKSEDRTAASTTGMDVFASSLQSAGITHIFGVMGDANLGWLSIWAATPGNTYFSTRHEAGAIGMAEGFADAPRTLGVSTITYGPGLLNSINALSTAVRGRQPQVVLLGSTPVARPFHVQRYDHEGFVRLTGAEYVPVRDPEFIEWSIKRAVEVSLTKSTVVVLDISAECLERGAVAQRFPRIATVELHAPPPSGTALRSVAELIREATGTVILAGVGSMVSGASASLEQIASHTGAALATTLAVRGMFADHPNNVGVFGGFSTPATRRLIHDAELIVVFGASLNEYTTHEGTLLEGKTVVQVDADRGALGRQHPVTFSIHADAAETSEALLDIVISAGPRVDRHRASLGAPRQTHVVQQADEGDGDGVDPRYAMTIIDGWLPDDRVVVTDGGHFVEWPSLYLRAPRAGSFRTALAGGSIGLALPQAIGMAASGRAQAHVVVVGDGGFFMSLTEIETAVRLKIPVIVIVLNDAAYAAEVHKLRKLNITDANAYFENSSDIADVARGFGAIGVTIQSEEDFALLPNIASLDIPLVIDVKISRSVVSSRLAVKV